MQTSFLETYRSRGLLALLAVALLLAACGTTVSTDGVTDEDGDTAQVLWSIIRPAPADEVDGFDVTVDGGTVTGTDSDPSGWTLVVSRPGGFTDLGTYSSAVYDDGSGTGDLTVTFTGPDATSCTVSPANTSISEDGPNPGDTYAQVTYLGTTDGIPTLAFGVFAAACDGLPGASGSGEVDGYLFGIGAN